MTESATEPTVLLSEHDSVAVITLNRPHALNSFTRQMHRDLWAALDRVEANPTLRAVVFTGAGRGFCAGQDLSDPEIAPAVTPGAVPKDIGNLIEARYKPLAMLLHAQAQTQPERKVDEYELAPCPTPLLTAP